MAEYIEREAAITELNLWSGKPYGWGKAVIERVPAADVAPVARWIPVTERMPEKHKRVFVCTRWKAIGIDFVNADGDWYTTGGVTHWMPLPDAPEG